MVITDQLDIIPGMNQLQLLPFSFYNYTNDTKKFEEMQIAKNGPYIVPQTHAMVRLLNKIMVDLINANGIQHVASWKLVVINIPSKFTLSNTRHT